MQYFKYMLMGLSVLSSATLIAQENTYVAPSGNMVTHTGATMAIFGNIINDARGTAATASTAQAGLNHNGGGTVYLYRRAAHGTGNSRIYDGTDNALYGTGSGNYNAGGKAVRFYNLITDNNVGTATPSGTGVNATSGSGHIQMEQEVSVSNLLTATNGIIWTPRGSWKHAYLHFDANGASYGGNIGAMNTAANAATAIQVDGYVAKTGASAFTFPIGDGVYMRRSALVSPAAGTYRSAFFKSNANNLTTGSGISGSTTQGSTSIMNGGIAKVNTTEFWDIDGTARSNYSLDALNSIAGYSNWNNDFSAVSGATASKIVITALDPWENVGMATAPSTYSDNGAFTTTYSTAPDLGSVDAPSSGNPFVAYTWAVAPVSTPVSLDLLSFDGAAKDCDAVLTWTTANEDKFSHFEVEYSKSGNAFDNVGRVNGGQSQYSFTYAQASGNGFYRLKMIDMDGVFAYSNNVKVKTECDANIIEVYPNPAHQSVSIKGLQAGNAVQLINVLGQTVATQKASGLAVETINISHLAAGNYNLVIQNGLERKVFKLVKQ